MVAMVPVVLVEGLEGFAALDRAGKISVCRLLRLLGLSFGEICLLTGAPRGTVYGWCRDISLTDEQRAGLKDPGRLAADAADRRGKALRDRRTRAKEEVRREAAANATVLAQDPFWVAGVVAYWAEGAKTSGGLRFANSDPELIRLFLGWAERYLGTARLDVRVQLHVHEDQGIGSITARWADELQLDRTAFYKPFVKPPGTGHRKVDLEMGTANVRLLKSGEKLQVVLGWIDMVRNRWALPLHSVRAAGATGSAADS